MAGEWMNAPEAAELIGISPGTLANWRSTGKGPRVYKPGRRCRYRRSEVNEWLDRTAVERAS